MALIWVAYYFTILIIKVLNYLKKPALDLYVHPYLHKKHYSTRRKNVDSDARNNCIRVNIISACTLVELVVYFIYKRQCRLAALSIEITRRCIIKVSLELNCLNKWGLKVKTSGQIRAQKSFWLKFIKNCPPSWFNTEWLN